jgi:hypothetical protein
MDSLGQYLWIDLKLWCFINTFCSHLNSYIPLSFMNTDVQALDRIAFQNSQQKLDKLLMLLFIFFKYFITAYLKKTYFHMKIQTN